MVGVSISQLYTFAAIHDIVIGHLICMSVLLIQLCCHNLTSSVHVSIVDSIWQCCLFDSQIANLASLPVLPNQPWDLNPQPCDTEAFGRGTAPIWIGHAGVLDKFDTTLAACHHMTFAIHLTEVTSETSKTPGHIANPVSLIFRYVYIKGGLTRFNTLPEFNT